MGFMDKLKEQAKEMHQKEVDKILAEKERIATMDAQGIPYCAKCKSQSVQYVERRKQLSVGRAVVGGALTGGLGAVVGAVSSNKHKGVMKCLKCGNEWKLK
jgi:DNA-directed RNA polymerase subunit M/transcription elongation factor TFIIS